MHDKNVPTKTLFTSYFTNKHNSSRSVENRFNKRNVILLILLLFLVAITAGMLNSTHMRGVVNQGVLPEFASGREVFIEAIIDVSGSMWGQVNGVSKIINSKEILDIVVKDLPSNVKLGLRTFGGKNETRLQVDLGVQNRKEISDLLYRLRPNGKSPIGYALEQAGKDLLAKSGERYILLISDGIDNGKIDPVAKAAELKAAGIITNVIYVHKSGAEGEGKLKQIASAGGGRYFTYDEKELLVPTMTLQK